MSGGPTTTSTATGRERTNGFTGTEGGTTNSTTGTSSLTPYSGTEGALRNLMNGLNGFQPDTGLNNRETEAFNGLRTASQYGIPELQRMLPGLLGGGGFGVGNDGVNSSFNNVSGALNPILNGNLDPSQNPATQQLISQITNQARNTVGDQFARGGRSFSGAHAGATGRAITEGLAPTLFGQYNTNVANRMNAGNLLMNSAFGRNTALDSSATGRLNSIMQAPGVIGQIGSQLGLPHQLTLQQEGMNRQIPLDQMRAYENMILPIASMFGTQNSDQDESRNFDTRTNTRTATNTNQNGTSATHSDPMQTAIGGGLGLLGLFL
jgi:hypothetical protein